VVSDERCIKPDAAHLPDRAGTLWTPPAGLQPQQLVFIDDAQKNIDACHALGWQGIHHVDAAQTRAQLRALGLPV
jgi:2-haloacid dehalogenase